MVDTSTCASYVRGRVMRLTRLDACGNRVLGPRSTVVSDGFVSAGYTAQTEEGEAITVTNANGKVIVSDVPSPRFTGYDVTITFAQVIPDMFNLLTGQPIVYNADGTLGVGFQMNDDVDLDGQGFAIEIWTSVPTAACTDTGVASYGYFLTPFLKGGIIGDLTFENAAINFVLSGAKSKSGSPWGVGPYDVVWDEDDEPGPLNGDGVPTTNHLHQELTQVEPPDAVCGAIPLGSRATTATAGSPATLGANHYSAESLADLVANTITASPSTAWTGGQYLLLLDGSKAHWSSTAWVAGPA